MKFDESDIKKYIRTHSGFFPSENLDNSFDVSVQTLVDMLNFFAKIAADEAKEDTLKNSSAYWLREKGIV